ncbi:MAG: DUF4392 domain-containing protein [Planctomycetaceae bacterium]|nr:DUF4392 domain-containing protein [Planctomycetaceae bacterium]
MQLADLERWIRRDPAARGFLAIWEAGGRPCADDLPSAAESLATKATAVGLVTGFFVPDAPTPAAETDGPIGTILLADVLRTNGCEVCLITDSLCIDALSAAVDACGASIDIEVCPVPIQASAAWRAAFWNSPRGRRLTHLASVERIGPVFSNDPSESRCCNMRGTSIDDWSADLYRLFEDRPAAVRTIGVGDGGNEIGMGRCWKRAHGISTPANACRTETDWTVVAGVSDWGAMALAAAVAIHKANIDSLAPWSSARIEHTLTHMVTRGPAIDGRTFRPDSTVDGLPFATYIQPWDLIRRELGLTP